MDDRFKPRSAIFVAFWLAVGYVGVYLCRKNLSVAIPLLQASFGVSKAGVGWIASAGNVAYMLGKFASGPVVDRLGGRNGFLLALFGVALLGGLAALAPGLLVLGIFYSLNRFCGSAGWGAMMKLTSTWFPPNRQARAIAALSMSFILGGVFAVLFAQQVVRMGGDWRMVFYLPSLALLVILAACARFVRPGPLEEVASGEGVVEAGILADGLTGEVAPPVPARARPGHRRGATVFQAILTLLRRPEFQTVCILSFILTFLRDAFGTWSVDFLLTLQSGKKSVAAAAVQSTGFELAGALPVLVMGVVFDRIRPGARRWVIAGILALLAGALMLLTLAAQASPLVAALLIALVGLLIYGPYSILGPVVAIESGGTDLAATANNLVDGFGYMASILGGVALGGFVDLFGYSLAFRLMAAATMVSALIALRLRGRPPVVETAGSVPA